MTAPIVDDAVSLYVLACEQFLDDLDETTRTQLRVDIAEIVAEVCGELDGEPADLVGPPFRFVNELRIAAGVGARRQRDAEREPSPRRVTRRPMRERLRDVWNHAATRWARALLPELRPAWWVARGVLLAWFVGHATGGTSWWLLDLVPMWSVFGSEVLGLATVAGAVYLSVEVGRRRPTGRRRFVVAVASIAAALFAFSLAGDVADRVDRGVTYVYGKPPAEPSFAGEFARDTFRPVQLGSDVTGEVFEVIDMGTAVDSVDRLLTTGPPAAIWIEHDGVQSRPGTQAALNQQLQQLTAQGYLNP